MIVNCQGGLRDGADEEIPDGTPQGAVIRFTRNLTVKSPKTRAYAEYILRGNSLIYRGLSQETFADIKA